MARGGRGFQGTVLKALRVPEHRLTVTGVRELPPYTELTVQCPSLLGTGAAALPPTTWVRMWIPEGEREYQRAYTLTRIDRARSSATILFLHHEPTGPASRWSSRVRPGARVAVQVMGGTSYRPPSHGDRLLLVGDRASAPALVDAVNTAPVGSPATVIMLAPGDGYLPSAERDHELIRLDPEVLEDRLLAAVDHILWADTGDLALDWAWIALESSATKAVRRHLVASGMSRRSIQHQAYWIRGRAMGVASEA
ncbi:siderophore-interacting protein [Actinomyces viscosus]|uniref:Iron import ATP-binding/permease protein IrtA n=1 Tax=Actinomyces viscosus TaxID=1656 RepID=A0A448PMQ0_ACTVI|nr:SIP domain-containing protein [Actinomyces viscosus]TFH52516.1 siderophore-interacting protein [Actinomyces viscosus]VEI17347.1 Iron import ATP-binding/permease protein IrtA [Actinomyces viscosus]